MSWTIACFCGRVFSSDVRDARCPYCKAIYFDGMPMPESSRVSDEDKQQMQDELDRLIELSEWGLLE